jgi:DNA-binding NtrC family response regulator
VGGVNLRLVIIRGLIDLGFSDAVSRRHTGVVELERWLGLPSGRRCFRLRTGVIDRGGAGPVRLILLRDVTDVVRLREAAQGGAGQDFITRDPHMLEVLRQLNQAAPTEAYVLIQGESGTGKNVLARMLHHRSPRAARPLVEVNCAAVPSELLESEFFGHVKGAFTGASADRVGRFAAADGGTLFLDEVGEVPLHLQAKFLKAVQERCFEPVGSSKSQTVDIRIVSASNRLLKDAGKPVSSGPICTTGYR